MAALNFPSSPTEGTEYTFNSTVWLYSDSAWAVKEIHEPSVVLDSAGDNVLRTVSDTLYLSTDGSVRLTMTTNQLSSNILLKADAGTITKDIVYTLTGTTPSFDHTNGGIQRWKLDGNATPVDSCVDGGGFLLMVQNDSSTSYTITWPTITWVNNAGTAPTLSTTDDTIFSIWKDSDLYGALVGDGS